MNKDARLKQLFSAVQNRGGLPLSVIFNQFAIKWNMKKNSIRNMYYLSVDRIKNDASFASHLGLDADKIRKYEIKPFSEDETVNLISEIEDRAKSGQSIRKACYELAGGDVSLMLRYQNKYRAVMAKKNSKSKILRLNKNLINSNVKNMGKSALEMLLNDKKGEKSKSGAGDKSNKLQGDFPDNIIPFRKKEDSLTDGELQSLFMGLVRIVRKASVADVNNALREQYNRQSIEIRNLIKNLRSVKEELNESQRENAKLKKELEIVKMDKIKDYANFVSNLNLKNSDEDKNDLKNNK